MWHSLAINAGETAIYEYFRAKGNSPTAGTTVGELTVVDEASITREAADLWQKFGNGGLNGMIGQFTDAIIRGGFPAASSDRFSGALVGRLKQVFKNAVIDRLHWTQEPHEVPTIEIVRVQSSLAFPVDAIRNKRNALCVCDTTNFGFRDLIHLYDACPEHVTVVDSNLKPPEEISLIYPIDWSYIADDYLCFIDKAFERNEKFDLIVFNVSAARAREVGLDNLSKIMRIGTDTVITNYTNAMLDELDVGVYEFSRLSDIVSKRTGIEVEFRQLNSEAYNSYWAVIRKR